MSDTSELSQQALDHFIELLEKKEQIDDMWASNTCLLRWDTLGVFKPDPSVVNCLDKVKIKDQSYIITGSSTSK